MKISIEKELEKKSQQHKESFNIDPINEVKLLLQGDSQEDIRILRNLSDNSQFNRIEHVRSQQIELEKHENTFLGKVYTYEQIQQLAIDYRLRLLPARRYTGSYDVEVAAKIKEFAKDTNTAIEEYSLKNKFYVLAPPEMFMLDDKQYITKKQMDPAIFYKIDDNHYRLVHKWGSDFTVFRYLTGFRWQSWWKHQWFNTALTIPFVATIITLAAGPEPWIQHYIAIPIITFVVSFLFAYLRWGFQKQDELEVIHDYFTPHNWNSENRIRR